MKSNSKKITMIALAFAVVALGVGFAAFSSTLTIQSSATVNPDESSFKVQFTAATVDANGNVTCSGTTPVTTLNPVSTGTVALDTEQLNASSATIGANANGNLTLDLTASMTKFGQEVTYGFCLYSANYDAYFWGTYGGSSTNCGAAATNNFGDVCNNIDVNIAMLGKTFSYLEEVTPDYEDQWVTDAGASLGDAKITKNTPIPVKIVVSYENNVNSYPDGNMIKEYTDLQFEFGSITYSEI